MSRMRLSVNICGWLSWRRLERVDSEPRERTACPRLKPNARHAQQPARLVRERRLELLERCRQPPRP